MLLLYNRSRKDKEYKRIKRNVIYGMSLIGTLLVLTVYLMHGDNNNIINYNNDINVINNNGHFNARILLNSTIVGCGSDFGVGCQCQNSGDCNTGVNDPYEYACVLSEMCVDKNRRYQLPGFYPLEAFTFKQLRNGAVILYIIGVFYTFLAIAIICDEYFVPAIEVIVEKLKMSPDTAGATFMAAGGSAPELFTSFIGTFISQDEVGFGTIVGSAVFNVLFVIGCCAVASYKPLKLTWYPFARDCTYYSIALITLAIFFIDGRIWVWEALILLLLYAGYVTIMMFNEKIYLYLDSKFSLSRDAKSKRNRAETQLRIPRAMTFNVSLFQLMTKDSGAADIAGIYLMKVHKGDIKDTFRQVDLDGNGTIDKEELRNVLRRLGDSDLTDQELEECYSELDLNGDGKIDYAEFEKWFLRSKAKMTADIDQIFGKYDVDDNGYVDMSELEHLVTEINDGETPDADTLNLAQKDLDSNGDGKIDRLEFIEWYKNSAFFEQRRRKQEKDAKETEHVEEADGIDLSIPAGWKAKINWFITLPIIVPFYVTIPDVRKSKWEKCWAVALAMSMFWLGVYSWLMVWWATVFGNTVGIPSKIMGLTLLAAGTSVPDLITSVIVARKGEGDMAVSSSIGSNIFDVLMGLPIPWFFYTITIGLQQNGAPYIQVSEAGDPGVAISIGVLFAMLVAVVLLIKFNKWTMTKCLGYCMFGLYAIFVAQDLAQYYIQQANS